MNDADIEIFFLVKEHHRPRKNGIEAPLGIKALKGGIDTSVVDFWSSRFVLLDGQFFPLTAEVQQF
jgi:hypothetical protein